MKIFISLIILVLSSCSPFGKISSISEIGSRCEAIPAIAPTSTINCGQLGEWRLFSIIYRNEKISSMTMTCQIQNEQIPTNQESLTQIIGSEQSLNNLVVESNCVSAKSINGTDLISRIWIKN